ncbi:MAG: tRNA (adenosine(37)-N6)-threonylcarbamoyltransferase complex dimerization subunit type 1 TsaB [Bacteroidota bacterium]
MLTLGIETATDVCSVALLEDNVVLAEAALRLPRQHAARLMPLIRDVLAHAGRSATDLDLVAVSEGPGSYTGLRIGVSTAKGLCLASGAALVGVGSLEALATKTDGVAQSGDYVVVAFPSRRGEVYAAGFQHHPHEYIRLMLPGAEPAAVPLAEFRSWWPAPDAKRIWLLGPAAALLTGDEEFLPGHTHVLNGEMFGVSAATVARIGKSTAFDVTTGDLRGVDVASFEPSYLKEFVAGKPRPLF